MDWTRILGVGCESLYESIGSDVPAFQASIPFAVSNHALTRVAICCRRFAPVSLPVRWKHKTANVLRTSLEEAVNPTDGKRGPKGRK
jgi:hypothetical protein